MIIFLFIHKSICCGYLLEAPLWDSLEAPWQGASNEYLQYMFLWRIIKICGYPRLSWSYEAVSSRYYLTPKIDHDIVHRSRYLWHRNWKQGEEFYLYLLFILYMYKIHPKNLYLTKNRLYEKKQKKKKKKKLGLLGVVLGIGQNFIFDHWFYKIRWSSIDTGQSHYYALVGMHKSRPRYRRGA